MTERPTGTVTFLFTDIEGSTPLWEEHAVFTVAFRPMPQEADNIQMTLTAFEGLILMALMVFSLQTVLSVPPYSTRLSYLTFVGMYILLFTFVFAAVGNFGVLARQRTQLLPFLLVIPALPRLGELLSRDHASSEVLTSVPSKDGIVA